MYHILIPDNISSEAIQLLEKHNTFSVNAPGKMSREEAINAVGGSHGLIIRSGTKVDEAFLDAAPALKVIARAGVGVDNVDLDAATARGVVVMNTPEGNTISTAEYTMGLILSLARHVPQGYESLKQGRWDRKAFSGVELRDKTLGLVGFGRIGRAVAKRALAFDMTVIAYDPYVDTDVIEDHGAQAVDLDTLYARSDFISLHTLINDDTREMIDSDAILKMKIGVRIVNAARGPLINDEALANALKHGHVSGAALDVFHEEPPPRDHPLIGLPNVIATPHLAASTEDAQIKVGIDAAQQVIDALAGGSYRNVVNPAVLES